tara:strand:- start:341 stop:748 length:408 start_codon:yes stop_codon:yes gene_type:complete
MMQKNTLFYFLCVIFLFNSHVLYASFPVESKIFNDRISQPKKETVEENKVRMQKQLYGYDGEIINANQKIDIHRWIFTFFLVTALVGAIMGLYAITLASWKGFELWLYAATTVLFSCLGMIINFLVKITREAWDW